MDEPTIAAVAAVGSSAVSSGVFLLSLYQAIRQGRLIERTSELQAEVNRLAVQLDQSLQLLYHARDQAKQLQRLFIVTRNPAQQTEENIASVYTHVSDLEALISVVGNEKVKKIWHEEIGKVIRTRGATEDSLVKIMAHGDMSLATQHLLESIYEMIRDATAS